MALIAVPSASGIVGRGAGTDFAGVRVEREIPTLAFCGAGSLLY
jgi:hypothetical protein